MAPLIIVRHESPLTLPPHFAFPAHAFTKADFMRSLRTISIPPSLPFLFISLSKEIYKESGENIREETMKIGGGGVRVESMDMGK